MTYAYVVAGTVQSTGNIPQTGQRPRPARGLDSDVLTDSGSYPTLA